MRREQSQKHCEHAAAVAFVHSSWREFVGHSWLSAHHKNGLPILINCPFLIVMPLSNLSKTYQPVSGRATSQATPSIHDLLGFLLNPGRLEPRSDRTSEAYRSEHKQDLAYLRQHLKSCFSKPLSKNDLAEVGATSQRRWAGATPLHIAAYYRGVEVVKEMLSDNPEAKDALNKADARGRTVLDWAEKRPEGRNQRAIIELLKQYGAQRSTGGTLAPKKPLRATSHTPRPLILGPRTLASAVSVPPLSLCSVHVQAEQEAILRDGSLAQVQRLIREKAGIEQKFRILHQGIQKSLRLPADVHTMLKQHARELRRHFAYAIEPPLLGSTRQELEAQRDAIQARNNDLMTCMENLRQQYVQAQKDAAGVQAAALQRLSSDSVSNDVSANFDDLRAENVALLPTQSEPKNEQTRSSMPTRQLSNNNPPQISKEHAIASGDAADSRAAIIKTINATLDEIADHRREYETLQAQLKADSHLDDSARTQLLAGVEFRLTLMRTDDECAIDEMPFEALEKYLTSLQERNARYGDEILQLREGYEKTTTTIPVTSEAGVGANPTVLVALPPPLAQLTVHNLELLETKIQADPHLSPAVRNRLTADARKILTNSFLQLDPKRIAECESPRKKAWMIRAQTTVQKGLGECARQIHSEYEKARIESKLSAQPSSETRLTGLRPAEAVEREATQLFEQINTRFDPTLKTLVPCSGHPALTSLPAIEAALPKLAQALHRRLIHRSPYTVFTRAINAATNWRSLRDAASRAPEAQQFRAELIKRQATCEKHLGEAMRMLDTQEIKSMMHEHERTVTRCSGYLDQLFGALQILQEAQAALQTLAETSSVAEHVIRSVSPTLPKWAPRCDAVIEKKILALASAETAHATQAALNDLQRVCGNAVREIGSTTATWRDLHAQLIQVSVRSNAVAP